jgi:hypothetical protein
MNISTFISINTNKKLKTTFGRANTCKITDANNASKKLDNGPETATKAAPYSLNLTLNGLKGTGLAINIGK